MTTKVDAAIVAAIEAFEADDGFAQHTANEQLKEALVLLRAQRIFVCDAGWRGVTVLVASSVEEVAERGCTVGDFVDYPIDEVIETIGDF